MYKPEYVLCAAVWCQNGKKYINQPTNIESGFVFTGKGHANCYNLFFELMKKPMHIYGDCIQGFITNHNRFVDRVEGAQIALSAGQIAEEKRQLYSEDLY